MLQSIHTRLALVMAEIPAVAKKAQGKDLPYAFRSIDDFINAVGPVLARHEVTLSWQVEDCQRERYSTKSGSSMVSTLLRIRYRFSAPDGSYMETVAIGEGFDSGDKSANKAMSAALKYALAHTLMIPTQDRADSEYEEPDPVHDDHAELKDTKRRILGSVARHRQGAPSGMTDIDWIKRVRSQVIGDRPADTLDDAVALEEAIPYYDPATGDRMP